MAQVLLSWLQQQVESGCLLAVRTWGSDGASEGAQGPVAHTGAGFGCSTGRQGPPELGVQRAKEPQVGPELRVGRDRSPRMV
jgi:hypothetical protein